MAKQMVNIADVCDIYALKDTHPSVSFLQTVDKCSGCRIRQMLVSPVINSDILRDVCRSSTSVLQ